MLTSYAGCWASFMLRGLFLALFGIGLLSTPDETAVASLPILASVLAVSGANAISVGLRLRALSRFYGLLLVEGGLAIGVGAVALFWPPESIRMPVICLAALATANGLLQFVLAWQYRRSTQRRVWPVAAVAGVWVGFALMLSWQPLSSAEGWSAGMGALALLLGAALVGLALHLRSTRRLAQHELLRDAPLAPRTTIRAPTAARPVTLYQATGRRPHAAHHAA